MTRFLTPAKIGLLILIELYTDAIVPTASTIPILSFIINQILPATHPKATQRFADKSHSLPFVLDLKAFETLLKTDYPSAAGLPGRSLWDHFLKKLWGIDSLDALHVFFARRQHLLAKNREDVRQDGEMGIPPPSADMILLSQTSPFGSFVRKANVEFERLRFGDTVALWTSLLHWRHVTKSYWSKRHAGLSQWSGDKALHEGIEEWGSNNADMLASIAYGITEEEDGCVSTDDIEKLLEFQVEQMQSTLAITGPMNKLLTLNQSSETAYQSKSKTNSRIS